MKRRERRKKKQRTTICLTVFVLGTMSIGAIVSIGILHRKQNTLVSPEELLVEYMSHIPEQEYKEMYAILNIEASRNISQDDFVKRNSAIYEGIEVDNMEIEVIAYDEERKAVTYQTSFDTVAGNISFENEAIFLKGEDGYKLAWDGKDIQLTIDADLQRSLYAQFKEDKSCSVAMNPYTGEVLALVSTPSYDNNDFIMGLSNEQWTVDCTERGRE